MEEKPKQERKRLFPGPGRRVRCRLSKLPYPAEGKEIVVTSYERRRLECGDLVETDPRPALESAPTPDCLEATASVETIYEPADAGKKRRKSKGDDEV